MYTPLEERLQSEAEVYFRPSSTEQGTCRCYYYFLPNNYDTSILAIAKMANIDDHWTIEEGLFIGSKPRVPSSHILTMSNRISQGSDKVSISCCLTKCY